MAVSTPHNSPVELPKKPGSPGQGTRRSQRSAVGGDTLRAGAPCGATQTNGSTDLHSTLAQLMTHVQTTASTHGWDATHPLHGPTVQFSALIQSLTPMPAATNPPGPIAASAMTSLGSVAANNVLSAPGDVGTNVALTEPPPRLVQGRKNNAASMQTSAQNNTQVPPPPPVCAHPLLQQGAVLAPDSGAPAPPPHASAARAPVPTAASVAKLLGMTNLRVRACQPPVARASFRMLTSLVSQIPC
eukprot:38134-Amphidinium_carterae.1